MMVIDTDPVAVAPRLSVTFTLKVNVPFKVGVPAITPVAAAIPSPGGSDPPTTVHVYGVDPPEAASDVLYAAPTTPSGWGPPANVRGETMVIETAAEAVAVVES